MALATNLGYPRIGPDRELKRATESYWRGELDRDALLETAAGLRRQGWDVQRSAGIDLIPCNDFSLYDHVLDAVATVGAIPARYGWEGGTVDLDTYFAMARGAQREGLDVGAMEMTKWFDTNYHYIVPEYGRDQRFTLASTKFLDEYMEARDAGVDAKPVLLGPISLLLLGKSRDHDLYAHAELVDGLLEVYREVLGRLSDAGAAWIQLDEPVLVGELSPERLRLLEKAYGALEGARGGSRVILQTYFGDVGDAYPALRDLPVDALGLDLVRGAGNVDLMERHGVPDDKWIVGGVVDGRNVWLTDLAVALERLELVAERLGGHDRLMVAPSCSLLHVPLDVEREEQLDDELRSWLSFARQKLDEVSALTRGLHEGRDAIAPILEANAKRLESRMRSERTRNPRVRGRVGEVGTSDERRASSFPERRARQRSVLDIPDLLPTTSIGSYPQTAEVRRARGRLKNGEMGREEYEEFIEAETRKVIELQDEIGLDVLVHGEFERSDMVEYFAQQLDGYAFTRHGWVQSYGSRYVRPPILFGDIDRPSPMTVRWFRYAQSLTSKPVKGMLTGPVTMLQWSFVRDDQPRSETCRQLALAVRDEVLDLEAAGAMVIQVDEPALREGLPLRRGEWREYLDWAVGCFRLATAGVGDATQIHTHMCYSEFNDIIDAIAQLDADVLLIENARSGAELLEVFREFNYKNEIGPGVYDIHSPRVPSIEEVEGQLDASLAVLEADQVWVTPDCGLKTRTYDECVPALRNMVEAARRVRSKFGT